MASNLKIVEQITQKIMAQFLLSQPFQTLNCLFHGVFVEAFPFYAIYAVESYGTIL